MILATVLKYMDTKTLGRMATINSLMQCEYKKRIISTVFGSELIDKACTVLNVVVNSDEGKGVIDGFATFNTVWGEAVLALVCGGNKVMLYDMLLNQLKVELIDVFGDKSELAVSVVYHRNVSLKADYVIVCSNRKNIIIYAYSKGYTLKEIQRIKSTQKEDKRYSSVALCPLQIITADYLLMINSSLDLISFEGKVQLSISIRSESLHVKAFLSQKDSSIYCFTFFCQGISSFKLLHDKKIQLKPYQSYASWNKQTNLAQDFLSKDGEEYLVEGNMGNLLIWEFHTAKCVSKISLSLIDVIFSITEWNGDMMYLSTYSGKLYQVCLLKGKVERCPIVFDDISQICSIRTAQPSLLAVSHNGLVQVLTYPLTDLFL